jgi:ribosomal protein S18 acetylase RimI-like enzyme
MTTEGLKIIQASVEDVQTLQVIARETFFESFAAGTNADDMQAYLEDKFSIEQLQNELQHPESIFFIAWDQDKAIGYLKVNTGQAQTDLRDETSLEIQRIYVKSDYHGKSVGQLLCAKALEIAHKHQKSYIWLGVWEKNPRAIRFYEKHGFFAFDAHIFEMGDDQQTDIMMKKILNEQAISI